MKSPRCLLRALCASVVKNVSAALVQILIVVLVTQSLPLVLGCGPQTIEPIFVFKNSPDLPFEEFVKGKIGVLQSTLGRKSLVIAHRYLNGGIFTEDEQRALVEALKGQAPEDNDDKTIKAWIAARKEVVGEEKELLPIYNERRHGRFDFFPNCTKNAFEVATQTLKERVGTYGAEDSNVRDWIRAQDIVFKNCAEGAEAPPPVAAGGPRWLQKDREYQTAAALFYSLNFKEARVRFQSIAEDVDSVWQETAGYLIARTLVREASLSPEEKTKKALYEQAETTLSTLIARGGKFQSASQRLLGLVKYRLRPDERVIELAQVLTEVSVNENLRQDLIDYVWRFPTLSPWVSPGIPRFWMTAEEPEYYLELAWWCRPSETEYEMDGTEVRKSVPSPRFLSAKDLTIAKRERALLIEIGNAKSYLGKRVLAWAKRSPDDPRIPEALFIGAQANQSYKYGCGGWEQDEEIRTALEKLLHEKYPQSEWTAKLNKVAQ
jgi:hypothetical protein